MKLKFYIPLFLGLLFAYSASAQNDVAIKTNVLYDLTATVNAGVEIGLAPRWTLDVSGNFNAWDIKEGKSGSTTLCSQRLATGFVTVLWDTFSDYTHTEVNLTLEV